MPLVAVSSEPLKIGQSWRKSLRRNYSAWTLVYVGILFMRIYVEIL